MSGNKETEYTKKTESVETKPGQLLLPEARQIQAQYSTSETVRAAETMEELRDALMELYNDWSEVVDAYDAPGIMELGARIERIDQLFSASVRSTRHKKLAEEYGKRPGMVVSEDDSPSVSHEEFLRRAAQRHAQRAMGWQKEWEATGEQLTVQQYVSPEEKPEQT